jgi:hypothetical protein
MKDTPSRLQQYDVHISVLVVWRRLGQQWHNLIDNRAGLNLRGLPESKSSAHDPER